MKRIILITALLLYSLPAASETPPVPARKDDAINKYSKRLDQETKAKGALNQKIKSVKKDLSSTKEQLIKIAEDINTNETELKALQQRIKNLEEKKDTLNQNVQNDKKSIARLITVLQRIKRTPPEAMFAKNQSPYKTAQSISIMRNIIPSINKHAEKLNATLNDLNDVTDNLKEERTALMAQSEELQVRRKKLSILLSKRKTLHAQIDQDIKIREITIQKISLQAKSLEELVTRIKKEEQLEEKRRKAAHLSKPKPKPVITKDEGDARLPISGIIRTGYNKTDDLGAKSKGLTIEGRANSLVIAPLNGKIQYTGTFKRYGNLVIIEHANGYHSLIAGMSIINVNVGANVKTGEPIGSLPNSSLNPRPTVYYELRRNGKPVNPARKFAQLG